MMSTELSIDERIQLVQSERVIEEGYVSFLKVGLELARIRDDRLYRHEFGTFEDYCDKRWHLTRTRAYELISAAEITYRVSEISDIAPASESQAKALRGLEPETAAEVMRQAAEDDGPVTAKKIRDVREGVAPSEPKPAHVTTTTKTTESTTVEHDVDLDTGEIVSMSAIADTGPDLGDARREALVAPEVLAGKAIDRFRDAVKTVEAAGGITAIVAALNGDKRSDESWLGTLETAIATADEWAAAIRRGRLKAAK